MPRGRRTRQKKSTGFDWIQQEPIDLPAPVLIKLDESIKAQPRTDPQPKPPKILSDTEILIREVNEAMTTASVDNCNLDAIESKLTEALVKEATSAIAEIGIQKLQEYQQQQSNEQLGIRIKRQIESF